MGLSVIPHNPGAVNGQNDMFLADSRIVQYLVIAPLQEGGINRENRKRPVMGKTGGKGDGVLLRDSHIKKAFGETDSANPRSPVPDFMAAEMAQIRRSSSASAVSSSPNTEEKQGEEAGVQPVSTSKPDRP